MPLSQRAAVSRLPRMRMPCISESALTLGVQPLCASVRADPLVTTRALDWYPLDQWNLASLGQSSNLALPANQAALNCTTTGLYKRLLVVPLDYVAKSTDHVSITITYSGTCWADGWVVASRR